MVSYLQYVSTISLMCYKLNELVIFKGFKFTVTKQKVIVWHQGLPE